MLSKTLLAFHCLQSREKGGFVRDTEEEYEDAQGNVYNKKTYDDLKRQGIID